MAVSSPVMPVAAIELVDRDAELARLCTCLEDARYGRGGLLAVEGEAGIGKSALLAAVVDRAATAGMRTLAARGSELERSFPWGIVRQAFERAVAGRDELFTGRAALAASMVGESAHDAAGTVSEGRLHGLYWLLAALADADPLLLVVDDAHWGDEESVAFLRFLAVRLGGLRTAVVVATRPPGVGDPVAGLLADPAVVVVRPGALSANGTARMLARRLGSDPDVAFSAACQAVTDGNPFLLQQLAETVRSEGIEPTAAHARHVAGLRPEGIARSLLARLDEPTRSLAEALAILGDDVTIGLAAELAGLDPATAEQSADSLVAAGVIADARPLVFRHALIRGAVLGGIAAGKRKRAHASAARLLSTKGVPAEGVAAQLLQLEPLGDPVAAVTLREAADEATGRGAPASATVLLRRALQEPLRPDERVAALMALGTAEQSLGRPTAADHFIEAAGATSDHRARVEAVIAACLAAAFEPARSARALELLDGIDLADADRELTVRVLNARLAATFSDIDRYPVVAAAAEGLPDLTGATAAECQLLAHLARIRLAAGGSAVEVAELAERAAQPSALDDANAGPSWFVPVIIGLTAVDSYDAAERLAERAIDRANANGALTDYLWATTHRARIAWLRGKLDEAEGLARSALEAGESVREWWRLSPVLVLIETLLDQGRVEDATGAWTATGLGETVPRQRPLTPLLQARARLRLEQGDPQAALGDLREITERLGNLASENVNGLVPRLRTAEALHALHRTDEALTASGVAVDVARRFGAASSLGAALRVHGRLARDEDALREAVQVLNGAPAQLERARALIDFGASLRRGGARRDSRGPLRTGHDLAQVCGARALAEQARTELAASGIRVARRDPVRRDELTPSERRIAQMAADGAYNKEIAQALFLSVKTVEMHLSNAYRKLDVRSRRHLPKALASHADDQDE